MFERCVLLLSYDSNNTHGQNAQIDMYEGTKHPAPFRAPGVLYKLMFALIFY